MGKLPISFFPPAAMAEGKVHESGGLYK